MFMLFQDRNEAAHFLSLKLSVYQGQNPLVLGIPRGAVPMAKIIAEALGGELDVVLVHKLGAPGNPEFAIGSVDELGNTYVDPDFKVDSDYLKAEIQAQLAVLNQRRRSYTPIRSPIDPQGRIVIIVDNGIATGFTIMAAIHGIRSRKPLKIIAAVAVAPPQVVQEITAIADEMICLESPVDFRAVGRFYRDFHQVSDQEVMAALA